MVPGLNFSPSPNQFLAPGTLCMLSQSILRSRFYLILEVRELGFRQIKSIVQDQTVSRFKEYIKDKGEENCQNVTVHCLFKGGKSSRLEVGLCI